MMALFLTRNCRINCVYFCVFNGRSHRSRVIVYFCIGHIRQSNNFVSSEQGTRRTIDTPHDLQQQNAMNDDDDAFIELFSPRILFALVWIWDFWMGNIWRFRFLNRNRLFHPLSERLCKGFVSWINLHTFFVQDSPNLLLRKQSDVFVTQIALCVSNSFR